MISRRVQSFQARACTAAGGALVAMLIPVGAQAACSTAGVNPVTITCAADTSTTNTTNATSPNPATSDRTQQFGTNLVGVVHTEVTVSGFGLTLVATGGNHTIDMVNNGTVTSGTNAVAGMQLVGDGGLVTYAGNGGIVNANTVVNPNQDRAALRISNVGAGSVQIGSAGTPVVPNFTGSEALAIDAFGPTGGTVDGNQQVFLHGGTLKTQSVGLQMTATGTGSIFATLTGNTTILQATSSGASGGISASAASGSVTIASDANIGTSTGTTFNNGISATSTGGGVNISQTGGTIFARGTGTLNAGIEATAGGASGVTVTTSANSRISMNAALGNNGIRAVSPGSTGGIAITGNGTIDTVNAGVLASISSAFNPADGVIEQNGSVTAVTTGIAMDTFGRGSLRILGSGNITANLLGIYALHQNNAIGTVGNVTVSGSGSTTAINGTAIGASISGANNTGAIIVDRSGAITAGDVGVIATSAGNGNIRLVGLGPITAGTVGVFAQSLRNGDISVEGTGSINAGTIGIGAIANGTGTVSVIRTGAITAGNLAGHFGIAAGSLDGGDIVVNPGGPVSGNVGIAATTATPGNISVTITSPVTGTGNEGIRLIGGTNNTVRNSSDVSGAVGITSSSGTTTVINSGRVTGSSGTAVRLSGGHASNNVFIMEGPNAALVGIAVGSGQRFIPARQQRRVDIRTISQIGSG